jgi:hypothetical protein
VGEIILDASIVRPVYHVRDRDGKTAIVALYFDDATKWTQDRRVKVGNTICVMYAEQKVFMDGSQGIRCEDPENVQGIDHFAMVHVSVALFVTNFDGNFRHGCFWRFDL